MALCCPAHNTLLPLPFSRGILQTQARSPGLLVSFFPRRFFRASSTRLAELPHTRCHSQDLVTPTELPWGMVRHGQQSPKSSPGPSHAGQMSADSYLASLRFSQRKMWSNCTISKQIKVFVSALTMPKQLEKDELGRLGKIQNKTPTPKQKHISTGC